MDARNCRPSMGMAALCATLVFCSTQNASAQHGRPAIHGTQVGFGASPASQQPFLNRAGAHAHAMPGGPQGAGQSENFIVLCNDPGLARTVSQEAEKLRKELAVHWLGEEIPNWSRRCPIHVTSGATLGAGGETRFSLYNGNVGDWHMSVQGTPERILDSVLPHEITHTILASHFAPLNTHVPRWADEGACTTVEHDSEQGKHKSHLVQFLSTGRGLSFNRMFSLKDYPSDILPLYAQGHSVVEFLIAQGGPRKFVQFLEDGMQSQRWESAIRRAYGYETLGQLQIKWNQWIADGRGAVDAYAANPQPAPAVASLTGHARPASVPSLDAVASAGPTEDILEGASVQLVKQNLSNANAAVTNAIAAVPATTAIATTPLADTSKPANIVTTDAVAAAEGDAAGFYRQRLESNLRDIVRVTPGQPAAGTQAAPAARTATLERAPSSITIEPISQRATSRPQASQPTPTRVLDAGNQFQPPIYR